MVESDSSDEAFARLIAWLLRTQALLAVLVAVLFGFVGGLEMAIAALSGGAFSLFLTAIAGLRVALSQGSDAKSMVRTFYRAMALKFVLAAILFMVVAKWFAGYFLPVVIGYMVTFTAYWLAMRKVSSLPSSVMDSD